ncbi:hypothetical protein D6821_00095 [Candidatus Parcubacteria bacterium]|nr:MAG: hypothetical protein D6821_00095 [Candidatus Parcubacteria bacterium]
MFKLFQKIKPFIASYLLVVGLILFAAPAGAEDLDKMTITISPPLVKNKLNPGESWASTLKVVNNNIKPITVYVEAVDFRGEEGKVEFLPDVASSTDGQISPVWLSEWISLPREPIVIPPQQSKEVPYAIKVPANALPGGHYAAILIGTQPPKHQFEGSGLAISSKVTSLLLITVTGDTDESAVIREFSTTQSVYQEPKAKFKVKLENTGNVHILPQGEIRVINALGKEKGKLLINPDAQFGNVLPHSTRSWELTWQGDDSPLEMGRYQAALTIGFGDKAHQTLNHVLYFWVLNFRLIFGVLGVIVFIIILIIILIKLYIKRAIIKTQQEIQALGGAVPTYQQSEEVIDLKKSTAPIYSSSRDKGSKKIWILFLVVLLFLLLSWILFF